MIRVAIYLVKATVWTITNVFDVLYVPRMHVSAWYISKLRFLTIINSWFSMGYAWLCVARCVVDYMNETPAQKKHVAPPAYYKASRFHRLCDNLYAIGSFPLSVIVSGLFWVLYAIDRELVYPRHLDAIIPAWMNQVWHTAPIAFLLVDTLLVCHRYPTRARGCTVITIVCAAYTANILLTHYFDGIWLYPVFEVLNTAQRVGFFGGLFLVAQAVYLMGDALNTIVWGKPTHYESPEKPTGPVTRGQVGKRGKRD